MGKKSEVYPCEVSEEQINQHEIFHDSPICCFICTVRALSSSDSSCIVNFISSFALAPAPVLSVATAAAIHQHQVDWERRVKKQRTARRGSLMSWKVISSWWSDLLIHWLTTGEAIQFISSSSLCWLFCERLQQRIHRESCFLINFIARLNNELWILANNNEAGRLLTQSLLLLPHISPYALLVCRALCESRSFTTLYARMSTGVTSSVNCFPNEKWEKHEFCQPCDGLFLGKIINSIRARIFCDESSLAGQLCELCRYIWNKKKLSGRRRQHDGVLIPTQLWNYCRLDN